jgi:SAM-dependent methyltransferase
LRIFERIRFRRPKVGRRSRRSYYHLPEQGLRGREHPTERLAGLKRLGALARGRTVLDLGCAEGVLLRMLVEEGARLGHGLDSSPHRVAAARAIAPHPALRFEEGDLDRPAELADHAFSRHYDLVTMLGVYQQLAPTTRAEALAWALDRCADLFVFEGPAACREEVCRLLPHKGFAAPPELLRGNELDLFLFRRTAPR